MAAAIVQEDTASGGAAQYLRAALTAETRIQILLSVLAVGLLFLAAWGLLVAVRTCR